MQKLAELREQGVEPYANGFVPTHTIAQILGEFGALGAPELEALNQTFRLAGRLMLIREFGKASFCHFQDGTSRVQAYVQKQVLGPEAFALFKRLDLGDIVGFTGTLFRTKTGELTLAVTDFILLTKSLLPLPEKFHGLTDVETRYRQRYLDLMVNPQVREVFIRRAAIISLMRQFFEARGFLEVETPMMQPIPGGATARPFVTHHQALDMTLYLRIAPELYLKRLVIGGFDRVFEINRNFRNEGLSIQHNPEFTMLEFYQAYATYEDLMLLTEELICHVAREVLGTLRFACQGAEIDLTPPWRRLDLRESLTSIGGIPAEVVRDREALVDLALEEGVSPASRRRLRPGPDETLRPQGGSPAGSSPPLSWATPGKPRPCPGAARPTRRWWTGSNCSSMGGRWPTPSPSSTIPWTSGSASRPSWPPTPPAMKRCPTPWMRTSSRPCRTACRPPRVKASVSTGW